MIGMRIKMIPAKVGKIHNISFVTVRLWVDKLIPDLQFFKIFSEWMFLIFFVSALAW